MAHDCYEEHEEDISSENLQFGLENIAKRTAFENIKFNIKKVDNDSWKIINIEV